MPGITTSPGRLPKLRFVLPSLSSKTKQLWVNGNMAPEGKSSLKDALKWARIEDSESLCEQEATPMTPNGKSDGRNRDNGIWEEGRGCNE
ncbi:hypothetical protein PHLCEN_2v10107 [Hermanssonia centrifuga]|uniref:Uncharacterized protein n=1 Tax=Hermanssonia centrifuga TaxID=98765 RepID=A0A2R6NNX1_9APHY|nr:hypothetical protein PHLCEN_2v10107 [Hermanssonia centrifuga]